MGWPPKAGELLPRAEEAAGVRYKLASYSLDKTHGRGGAKAKGLAEKGAWKLVEIADDQGGMLDLTSVSEPDLELVWSASTRSYA